MRFLSGINGKKMENTLVIDFNREGIILFSLNGKEKRIRKTEFHKNSITDFLKEENFKPTKDISRIDLFKNKKEYIFLNLENIIEFLNR